MTAATILTLSNGKGIDLTAPRAEDIDFSVIAEHLAKEKRYNGATPGIEYPVAQHCVIGADAAFADTNDIDLAGYFLLHDGAEAFLKDDTTPKKRALAEIAASAFGVLSEEIMGSFDMLTDRFDAAIHEAAGLPWPPTPAMKAAIKSFDLVMFVTEWRDLMRSVTHPNWDNYRDITPLHRSISPWSWRESASAFRNRCKLYLPVFTHNLRPVTDDGHNTHSARLELNGGQQ
jgi:5'-deoxynucleotidase YfbR-like HD superfamily hydrolase